MSDTYNRKPAAPSNYSKAYSINTAMQVRKYRQNLSSVVPECFKTDLNNIALLSKMTEFVRFKSKSTRVTEELGQSKADIYSLNRIIQRENESIS